MDWFGKSSKAQEKKDMESLGISFEPIVFYPDRNEYELCIDFSGCPKELVKATYEMGKLKVEGQKYQTEFVKEFSIPADCLPTGIYGQYQGDVLHIIIPRLLSEWPRSEDASSKQEEDDRKATTEAVGEDRDGVKELAGGIKWRNSSSRQEYDLNASLDREKYLTARLPTRLPSDRKSTDEVVKERGGKDRDKLLIRIPTLLSSDQKEREGKDHDKLLTRVSTSLSSNRKEMKEKEGKDGDKLPTRVPAPSPSPSPSDNELFYEISAASPHVPEPSRSIKKLGENYEIILSKTVVPPPPSSPPSPLHAAATTPWNKKATEIRQEEGNTKKEKTVTESNDKEPSKVKKPSGDGGNKMLGLVAKVKETGKAAASAAMKEENRLVVMIGVVLTIVVLGASWRRKKKQMQINMQIMQTL